MVASTKQVGQEVRTVRREGDSIALELPLDLGNLRIVVERIGEDQVTLALQAPESTQVREL